MGKILLESNIVNDEYTQYLYDNYDIQTREQVTTEIPFLDMEELKEFDWNILLILGNSGSGKSTLLRTIGELREPKYDYDKCVVSQFPNLSPEETCDLLHGVGLSSIPVFLRKPQELSNGERARLDICWLINEALKNDEIILVDEFTSVVNRDVAKSLSFGLQRYIRKYNKKIILSSCHFDLIEWLTPDFIFNLNKKDKEGNAELERMIYADDKEYVAYQNINNKDILSEAKCIG